MAFGAKKFGSQRQDSTPVSVVQPTVESSADIAAKIEVLKSEHAAAHAQVEQLLGKSFHEKTFEVDVIAAQFRAPTLEAALGLRDQIISAQFGARGFLVLVE